MNAGTRSDLFERSRSHIRKVLVVVLVLANVISASALSPALPVAASQLDEPGTLIYEDTLAGPDSAGALGPWLTQKGSSSDYSVGYADGGYRIVVNEPKTLVSPYKFLNANAADRNTDRTNMRVEVDVTQIGGPTDGRVGIMCRFSDLHRNYQFEISSTGQYAIALHSGSDYYDLVASDVPSAVIRRGQASNRIRADCVGDTLTLYVNGWKLAEVHDRDVDIAGGARAGGFGMYASTPGEKQGTMALFKNIRVYEPGVEEARCFPQTGKCIGDGFIRYWEANGGLAQQGYPITDAFDEVNPIDGKVYRTQYFERARFEYHPENQPPSDVLLGLTGREQFLAKYPQGRPPKQEGEVCFDATQRCVSGIFYRYWQQRGGLAQQGYPISDEFEEVSPTDGKPYRVQYFERARFEHHPEHAGTPDEVLLGLLGREQFLAKYPDGRPVAETWGPTLPPLSDGRAYVDHQGRFSLSVPLDWTIRRGTPAAVQFDGPGMIANMNVMVSEVLADGTIETFNHDVEAEVAQLPSYAPVSLAKVVIGSHRAYRRIYRAANRVEPIHVEQVYFLHGPARHILTFVTTPTSSSQFSTTFGEVAGAYESR